MLIGLPIYGLCIHSLIGFSFTVSLTPQEFQLHDIGLHGSVAPKLRLPVDQAALNSVTRGLVGDSSFAVLPNISPKTTFILSLFAQIVSSYASLLWIDD